MHDKSPFARSIQTIISNYTLIFYYVQLTKHLWRCSSCVVVLMLHVYVSRYLAGYCSVFKVDLRQEMTSSFVLEPTLGFLVVSSQYRMVGKIDPTLFSSVFFFRVGLVVVSVGISRFHAEMGTAFFLQAAFRILDRIKFFRLASAPIILLMKNHTWLTCMSAEMKCLTARQLWAGSLTVHHKVTSSYVWQLMKILQILHAFHRQVGYLKLELEIDLSLFTSWKCSVQTRNEHISFRWFICAKLANTDISFDRNLHVRKYPAASFMDRQNGVGLAFIEKFTC